LALTYNQALDLLTAVDSLAAGRLNLEVEGIRLSVIKKPPTEAELPPAESGHNR
jgi:hypothetical protein